MKLLHKEKHFPCDQWNYKTTNKDNCTGHMQSLHLGRQFSCDQYDYKAIVNDNHTGHRKLFHEGIWTTYILRKFPLEIDVTEWLIAASK